MSKLHIFVCCVVALVVMSLSSSSQAYTRSKGSEYNVELYWKKLPVEYYIQKDGDGRLAEGIFSPHIQTSFNHWATPSCGCFQVKFLGLTSSREIGYNQDNPESDINLVLFQTESWRHDRNAVAVTSTVYSQRSGEIIAFDMEINAVRFTFSGDGQPVQGRSTVDLQNTITHEAGHVAGLDHSSATQATMFASAPPGETSKRSLHVDDIDGVCAIYQKNGAQQCTIAGSENAQGCSCTTHTHSPNKHVALMFFALFFAFIGFQRLLPRQR